MKGQWKAYAVALLVIGLIVGAGVGWFLKPIPPPGPEWVSKADYEAVVSERDKWKSDYNALKAEYDELKSEYEALKAAGLSGEVLIGSLMPLSGDLASFGMCSKVAIDMAVEEVNEFLSKIGAKWRMKVIHEDTETKPDVALAKLESLAAKGIKFVIGPQASAGVKNCKGYCDANKILLISQSSTSPALAIPNDFVFRFCPTDLVQGPAIARVMYDDGVRYIVAVWRGDAWGDGLAEAARKRFEELGGQVIETVRYAPEAKEFSAEVKAIADAVSSAVASYGEDKVGVLLISFEEAAILFTSAREYDILWRVRWYGSDGTALSSDLVEDPAVAEFCVKTRFVNPIFAPTRSEKYEKVKNRIVAELGTMPDSYAYAAYDIVWTLAYCFLAVDRYDPEAVRAILPEVASSLFGASGNVVLDENGDRAASDYDLWAIVESEPGKYKWEWVGTYHFSTDSVTWKI